MKQEQLRAEWRRQIKVLLPTNIAILLIVLASEPLGNYFHLPRFYMLFVPWLILVVWIPIAILQGRNIRRDWEREKREMQQRHDAEDAALFGTRRDISTL